MSQTSEKAVEAVAEYLAERDGSPCFTMRYTGAFNQRTEYGHLAAALLAGETWAFLNVSGKGVLDLGVELEGMLVPPLARS